MHFDTSVTQIALSNAKFKILRIYSSSKVLRNLRTSDIWNHFQYNIELFIDFERIRIIFYVFSALHRYAIPSFI